MNLSGSITRQQAVSGNAVTSFDLAGVVPVHTIGAGLDYRLLESGDNFLLENGDYKILG